jgi:hypothetical protein
MRFRLSTKPTWSELRDRLAQDVPAAFPATLFTFSPADDEPLVTWFEGPAEGSVAAVMGDVPGWACESTMLGPDPDAPSGMRVVRFDRSFSDAALALAVVRYQASGVRPFERARPGAVERLWAILEEDEPSSSGYPITDAIRDLLVGAPEPAGVTWSEDGAERWAQKLAAIGYDALWNQAYASVDL